MNFNNIFVKSVRTRSQLYNYQTVRWRGPKKPFWLGLAKSKMFVIPEPKVVHTPEEKALVHSLMTHYKICYNSMLSFIKSDDPRLKEMVSVEGFQQKIDPALAETIAESLKMNESWNKESARRRDERMEEDMKSEMEKAIRELDFHEELRMKQMELLEEIVKKEKEVCEAYITPENLDEAIEKCLDKVECFDFAIDLEGNLYHGRESLLSQTDEKKGMSAENK